MHTTTLLSIFLTTLTTAHLLPPQPPHPYILPRTAPSTQEKCTFTLYHKQISSNPRQNYIYLSSLTDHANNIVIDIGATRPPQERNSYTRLSATQKYAVKGLLGGDALTISARDGEDELGFEMASSKWEVGGEEEEVEEGGEAGCRVREWVEGGLVNRERKVECAFPCRKIDEVEKEEEREELK
ncbi:hypothetical protein COCC4DRAFT_142847 [Bipolaris maydis ATCC 48331]|uniref:Uncharacterized protein n=2 Tax=Cochliobolus heterostrophus TaxID=5016 RepID=M2U1I1_COCH5|nr:uncharacterized protein COCC4DRAFT_142847 [Bipolaris maydis ATCC 48331]EMD87881.1 hypothetical protein COCHEDRAFT_22477 [Bipolaris maydis C5]KAH7552126.1 hypothetical protein BM1_08988 [Bipolaris maydis]ENI03395.1 hypothetical protein COCC4DRAFT_142847 [Bipolaris maydis ATCC 48331]KAJ5024170.1 hypothetical protein J3E73DRAFT_398482 [Bipolaris maydis]KAJ5057565.1 hypothetical protein J3E74DRAFT_292850 [Bipolaris maydis]